MRLEAIARLAKRHASDLGSRNSDGTVRSRLTIGSSVYHCISVASKIPILPVVDRALIAVIAACIGYEHGQTDVRRSIPSCLLVNRPPSTNEPPWGYDGKVGVDIHGDEILGGGIYVSLAKWKRAD